MIPHTADFEDKVLLNRLKMIAPPLIPLSLLHMATELHGGKKWPWWICLFFSIVPAISVVLTLHPEHHLLFVRDYRLVPFADGQLLGFGNGPWFAYHNFQARVVMVISLVLIYTSRRNFNPYHRVKTWLLLVAILIPFIADSIAVAMFPIFRFLQLTPALTLVTALCMVYAVFWRQMWELVPFARHQILDTITDVYLVLDTQQRLVDFNHLSADSMRIERGHLGQPLRSVLGPFPDLVDRILSLQHGQAFSWQREERHYEVQLRSLHDSFAGRLGSIIIFKDVTLQRKIERDLEEINRMKTQLLAIMGHDLQGNLASLNLLAEGLMKRGSQYTSQDLQASAENIYFSAKNCIRFVDQLLVWSKSQLDLQPLPHQLFSMVDLTNEVIDFLQPLILDRDVQVLVHSASKQSIRSDPHMARVVIQNLLSNALQHAPEGTGIDIRILRSSSGIEVSVEDRGKGVAQEQIEGLFDFKRGDRRGLGLFLCKDFVDRLGGKIWYEKRTEGGSRFAFVLPCGNTGPQTLVRAAVE